MEALAFYVRDLLKECDKMEFPQERGEYDTTATEQEFMNANLGVLLPQFGIPAVRNRKDIDKVARSMMGLFGL